MISKKLVLVLSLCVAGSFVPLKASVVDCQTDATLQGVFNAGGVCTIGAYTFTWDAAAFASVESNPGQPTGGITASQINITDLLNANGTGFTLTPSVTFSAQAGGNSDFEIDYKVTGTGINSIYLEVDGSVVPNAYDHVLEEYCLGGTTDFPPGSPNCPGNSPTGNQNSFTAQINSGTNTSATNSAGFSAQTSISILKDIDANGGPGGGTGDTATVSGVINQFGPAVVPEPGTYVLSCIGLGLMFFSMRKYSRS